MRLKKQNQALICRPRKGAMALPTMLLIGGIILEIGIAGLLVSYFFIQSKLGVELSAEALAVAQSGIQDAAIRIIRDKNFSPGSYTINIGNRSAQVIICKDSKTILIPCDTINNNKHEVTSLGIAQKKQRQIRAFFSVDNLTGEIRIESKKEIAL